MSDMPRDTRGYGVIPGDEEEIRSVYAQTSSYTEAEVENFVQREMFMKSLKKLIDNESVKPFDIASIASFEARRLFDHENGWGTDRSIISGTWEGFASDLKYRLRDKFGSTPGWPSDLVNQFVDNYLVTIPGLVNDATNYHDRENEIVSRELMLVHNVLDKAYGLSEDA